VDTDRDPRDGIPAEGDARGGDEEERSSPLRLWLRPRLPFIIVAFLLAALAFAFFWDDILIPIRSGQAGVLWNRFTGTQVDTVYGEGLHVISPLDIMHIYETRKQVARHEFDVLTVKGLRLHLALAIRFRPEYDLLGMLHERIGPDYLTRVVVPQTESVMRKQLGSYTAEQVYTNRGGVLTRAILAAMEEVGRNFVEVEDIIIRRIDLPDTVKTAIEDKLTQEELLKSYQFRLQTADREAERKRVEAAGIRDYQQIVDETLSDRLLTHQGIEATREIAESENPKVVVIGAGDEGVPVIIGK
jgi:prohibitin 1